MLRFSLGNLSFADVQEGVGQPFPDAALGEVFHSNQELTDLVQAVSLDVSQQVRVFCTVLDDDLLRGPLKSAICQGDGSPQVFSLVQGGDGAE